jgi:hypothetical protein
LKNLSIICVCVILLESFSLGLWVGWRVLELFSPKISLHEDMKNMSAVKCRIDLQFKLYIQTQFQVPMFVVFQLVLILSPSLR